MVYSKLGIDTDKMVFKDGDTAIILDMDLLVRDQCLGWSAYLEAANQIIEERIAAHVLEAALGDINFENGEFGNCWNRCFRQDVDI